ncbi:MAG: ArnT family glycosyltransferase [Candidatus Dadabacteria bacterium]
MKLTDLDNKEAFYVGRRGKLIEWLFYSLLLIFSLVQAIFTQVQDDEAYYWVYSKYLSWGYMDHPPMIALIIKMGSTLFHGNLGLRLFPVLLGVLTIFITQKFIGNLNRVLFYAIVLSVAILQIAGFFAVPDVPLLFFTSLFFLCFRNFLRSDHWPNVLFLGLATSCLFYSKYHGVLVVLFTVIAYPRVLTRYKIYVAAALVIIFYLPHLYWQYQHDWISLKFQLAGKRTAPYTINRSLDYLVGQLVIAGPLAGPIILYSCFTIRTKGAFERILKINVIGILAFFFFNSFRGNVEANWTAPALIPMVVLTHNFLQQHRGWRLWLYRLLPLSLLLVLFARIILIFDILPIPALVERFHSWKNWPKELQNKTGNLPVVFLNSYQRASMYWYYSGIPSYSLNTYTERRNNYDFWPVEDSLLGKKVFIADIYGVSSYPDSLQARLWKVGFREDSNFHSFTKIRIRTETAAYSARQTDSLVLSFHCYIPSKYTRYLQENPTINEPVKIGVFKDLFWQKDIPCAFSIRDLMIHPHQQVHIATGLRPGNYQFVFAIGSIPNVYTTNSNMIPVKIQ